MRVIYSFCELSKSFTSTSRHLAFLSLTFQVKAVLYLCTTWKQLLDSLSKASANHFPVRFFLQAQL